MDIYLPKLQIGSNSNFRCDIKFELMEETPGYELDYVSFYRTDKTFYPKAQTSGRLLEINRYNNKLKYLFLK